MTAILKVDTIQDTSGNNIINESSDTITIGASGDTISIPSGATFNINGTAGTGVGVAGITSSADGTAITIDSSENVSMAQNVSFNSGFGSASTAYGVRAWIRFDGTGTISIDASGGVSSIADVSVGSYTVNLSPSMPDVNYAIAVNPANGLLSTGNQQFPVTVCDWVGSSSFTVNVRQVDNDANTFISADGDPISLIVSR